MPPAPHVDPSRSSWFVVVPLKGGAGAKSRLAPAGRPGLARAMATDTLEAVIPVVGRHRTLVVTSDEEVCRLAASLGLVTVADPGLGLDSAAQRGVEAALAQGAGGVAVLLGDHPCLTPAELEVALIASARHTQAFVPDADGSGTAMVTTTAGMPSMAFGAGSASRHARRGLVCLGLDVPGLRLDVDTTADLLVAQRVGLGPRTAAVLAGIRVIDVQASIHTTDEDGGTALLDDGREITWDLASMAGSGLLHLRVGQRVSIELDPSERYAARVWIVGIGEGESIR